MGVQFIKTPAGDEMAVLPRAEYDALIAAALEAGEDAADIAAYDAAKADKIGSATLPFEVSQAMLKGASLLKALRLWRNETQMHLAFKTETSQGLIFLRIADGTSLRRWRAVSRSRSTSPGIGSVSP